MATRRLGSFGRRKSVALVGAIAIALGVWAVLAREDRPSYGGRPSESLNFKVPDRIGAERTNANIEASTRQVVTRASSANKLTQRVDQSTALASGNSFVDAVVRRDAATAFHLLVREDQLFFGSPAQFGAALARSAPWLDAQVSVTGPSIVATVRRQPQLDDALGLITANATVELSAVNESGLWHVDWRNRTVSAEPTLASAQAITDVALWAETRQKCQPDSTLEHDTGLVGVSGFAASLCKAEGVVSVGDVSSLDTLDDAGPFFDAFGSDVMTWGRVVQLRTPMNMQVVVAPIGERWVVVGLARPET